MKKINNFLIRLYLWTTPVAIFVFLSDSFHVFKKIGELPVINFILIASFISWFLLSFHFFIMILFSPSTREQIIGKLIRIQERDEREEQIVAKASRFNFFFILSVLTVLFAMSTARYGRGVDAPNEKRFQSFTIGHWELVDSPRIENKDIDGKVEKIEVRDLPLSKAGIVLLLIILHIGSFAIAAKRNSKSVVHSLVFIFALILTFSSNANATIKMHSGAVQSSSGLDCSAYLFVDDAAKEPNLALQMWGTGIYTNASADTIHPAALPLVEQGKLAIVVFDKPGLNPDPNSSQQGALVNKFLFNKHTQKDLVSCGEASLAWAQKILNSKKLFFIGHSEGAQLGISIADALIIRNSPLVKRLHTIYLSGTPMSPWKNILDFQLSKKPKDEQDKFWNAYASCDDEYLISFAETPCAYLKDAISSPSASDVLKTMWNKNPQFRFQVFQGLFDENTVPEPVMDFEKENRERKQKNLSFLKWYSRYYMGDHRLNSTAMQDMASALSVDIE